jgi:RNase_H superfamily
MSDTRIVLLDIETAPSLGWVWQKWEANVLDFKTDWYVLSYAWKVLGEKQVHVKGLDDYPDYNKDRENDKNLLADLWKVMDAADIIIAHNGDSFDIPKINTRFIFHRMQPPSPYDTIDTLKIARSVFHFDSNKLDDLGHYLNLGRKLPHTGFHLWQGCMQGKSDAWKTMKKYNGQDVTLLEKVYVELRPWAENHPSVNQRNYTSCPKCGSPERQSRGFRWSATTKKPQYQCKKCGGWYLGQSERKEKKEVKK